MENAARPLNFTERLLQARASAKLKANPPKPVIKKEFKPKPAKVDKQQKKKEKQVAEFISARRNAQQAEKRFKNRDPTAGKIEVRFDHKTVLFIDPAKNIPDVLDKYSAIINRNLKK